jgi:Transketolase, C-terminal subunit
MSVSPHSTYTGYCRAIAEIEREHPEVVFLEAGAARTASQPHVTADLAEQTMILAAAGLALTGKRVFVSALASPTYIARSYEQIRSAIAIPGLGVVLSSVQDGKTLNRDGAVRQMNEDFALMRVLPRMTVLSPADMQSAYRLTLQLASLPGPAYIRLSRMVTAEIYDADDFDFHAGGARLLSEGDGVTICANGIMVGEALRAAAVLSQQGIEADVIDCYSIKPFPEELLLASVRRTGCCVVAEKHMGVAGLYGAVAECLCRSYSVPVRNIAIDDDFGQSGMPDELQEYYGLTHREIVHNVVQVLAMRRR